METIEGNKIIAEFMGGVDTGIMRNNSPLYNLPSPMWGSFDTTLRDMTYHCDWNWMMAVVDKINKCPFDDMRGIELIETIHKYVKMVQISDAHLYVVEFINWHNSTLLKQTT